MTASRKSWGSHSARWQREARSQGLSPTRWNRWRQLPDSTRRETDPRRYAKGESVVEQRVEREKQRAIGHMKHFFPDSRDATLKRNVDLMNHRQRKWTAEASIDEIRGRARVKPPVGNINLWWY